MRNNSDWGGNIDPVLDSHDTLTPAVNRTTKKTRRNMQTDMFNLFAAIGTVNTLRLNYY